MDKSMIQALVDAARQDKQALLDALSAAGCEVQKDGHRIKCAWHDDKNPSSGVFQAPGDGAWLFKCQSCHGEGEALDVWEVRAKASGRDRRQVVGDAIKAADKPKEPEKPKPIFPTLQALVDNLYGDQVVEVYQYTHPETRAAELAVIRLKKKSFPQARPVAGGWQSGGVANPQPIYNRFRIKNASAVVVCEGEKDVHALHSVGIVATTAPMGADSERTSIQSDGKPGNADWSPLAGKRVILWGDFDERGREHIARVERIVSRLDPAPIVLRVKHESVRGAKDAADFVALFSDVGEAIAAVQVVIEDAEVVYSSSSFTQHVEDVISGKKKSIGWPWPSVDRMTQALIPGAITMLVGNPGATKSFMVIQAGLWWLDHKIPFAIYEMEDDMDFWLGRTAAVHSHCGGLTSLEWIAGHPAEARLIEQQARPIASAMANRITIAPVLGATLSDIAAWVEAKAKSGCRVLVVDPITKASEGDEKPFVAASNFMGRAKKACEQYGVSLVLTTHGRKADGRSGKGVPDLDSMAGGAAYSRFSSVVVWLEPSADDEDVTLFGSDGELRSATINRRLRILKARSGKGTGHTIGLRFDGPTLNTKELGIIANTKRAEKLVSTRPSRGERMNSKPSDNENPFP